LPKDKFTLAIVLCRILPWYFDCISRKIFYSL